MYLILTCYALYALGLAAVGAFLAYWQFSCDFDLFHLTLGTLSALWALVWGFLAVACVIVAVNAALKSCSRFWRFISKKG